MLETKWDACRWGGMASTRGVTPLLGHALRVGEEARQGCPPGSCGQDVAGLIPIRHTWVSNSAWPCAGIKPLCSTRDMARLLSEAHQALPWLQNPAKTEQHFSSMRCHINSYQRYARSTKQDCFVRTHLWAGMCREASPSRGTSDRAQRWGNKPACRARG